MNEIQRQLEQEGVRPSRAKRRESADRWKQAEHRMRVSVRGKQTRQSQKARAQRLKSAKASNVAAKRVLTDEPDLAALAERTMGVKLEDWQKRALRG